MKEQLLFKNCTATDKNSGFCHLYLRTFYNPHDYACRKPHHCQLEVAEDKIRAGKKKPIRNFMEIPRNNVTEEAVRPLGCLGGSVG